MKIYSIDVQIWATVYIRAESAEEATRIARDMDGDCIEVRGDIVAENDFSDPDLPDVSLSPAMTIHGPYVSEVATEVD